MSSCSAIGFDSAASSAHDLLSEQFMARILKNRHGWKIRAKSAWRQSRTAYRICFCLSPIKSGLDVSLLPKAHLQHEAKRLLNTRSRRPRRHSIIPYPEIRATVEHPASSGFLRRTAARWNGCATVMRYERGTISGDQLTPIFLLSSYGLCMPVGLRGYPVQLPKICSINSKAAGRFSSKVGTIWSAGSTKPPPATSRGRNSMV
jgi:hypothetical protein